MYRTLIFILLTTVFMTPAVMAKDENKEMKKDKAVKTGSETKELSGMSIVGNDEAPKSLYIVPWKSSEIGLETSLTMALDEKDAPVDRDVFKRKLDYYELSNKK